METFLALSKVSVREWKSHQLRELGMTSGCQTCRFPLLVRVGRGGLGAGCSACRTRGKAGAEELGTGHWGLCRHMGAGYPGWSMQGKVP